MTAIRVTGAQIELRDGAVTGVANARRQWQYRRSLLLRLHGEHGQMGLGEAAPLPGYSPDSVADCQRQLAALDATWKHERITADRVAEIANRVHAPAARFALETALLDLLAQDAGWPLWRCIRTLADCTTSAPPQSIPLNAVCTAGEPEQILAHMARAYNRGIRCFKLKVGRRFTTEVAALVAARAIYGDTVAVRVDANQTWPRESARDYLARLAAVDPEYVEEPVAEPHMRAAGNLIALAPVPVAVALDESLMAAAHGTWLDTVLDRALISVLVLKPMILGGFTRCLALAAQARRAGADVVISHLFDGPVALAACAHLGFALALRRPCGLDRHSGLDAWPDVAIPGLRDDHFARCDDTGLGLLWSTR